LPFHRHRRWLVANGFVAGLVIQLAGDGEELSLLAERAPSQIAQVNEYASRIVLPYRPRAVVLYAGDNDLSGPWSKTPEQVFRDFTEFVEIIHAQLPETWIYYISIKPSILRWGNWKKFKKTNELIAAYVRTQPRVQFIDVAPAMLDAQGKPRRELFRWDGLHMNADGYAVWTAIIKPVLLSRFANTN
jgi:lysophospholipase L1-like esterase